MPPRAPQLALSLPRWGGAREGAGRKPRGPAASVHDARERFTRAQPVHVAMRVREHVWNLRSERSFAAIRAALERTRARRDLAVVHFSVQGNHLHLLVEADGPTALANGMRSLVPALAHALNGVMGRRGPVFAGRYSVHVLRTPAEARHALRYVLGNHASHARRRGEPLAEGFVDRYSSATAHAPRAGQLALWLEPAVREPRTWLLRAAATPLKRVNSTADSSHG